MILIDDYSTDATLNIIKSYKDNRIRIFEKPVNKGLVDSLNFGIAQAKGLYIARMDGDDISLPTRFAKQVRFLNDNPKIDICATNTQILGTEIVYNYPEDPDKVKVNLLFGSSIVHASLMGKLSVFKKFKFDPQMKHAEDYDLWTRMAFDVKMTNMPEILYLYRPHGNQVSNRYRKIQIQNCFIAQQRMFEALPYNIKDFDQKFLKKALRVEQVDSLNDIKKVIKWFENLESINSIDKIYKEKYFNTAILNFQKKFIAHNLYSPYLSKIKTIRILIYVFSLKPLFVMKELTKNVIKRKHTQHPN